MREVKLKCWGKRLKRWLSVCDMPLFPADDSIEILTLGQEWCEFVRFTGLHDKNGKEIYEGDVCNVRRYPYLDGTRSWYVCEALWGSECGWIFRGYYTGRGYGDYYGVRFSEVAEIEIIGNIYENPELLK